MTGKHRANRHNRNPRTTCRPTRHKTTQAPIVRVTLGALASLAIAFAVWGVDVGQPPEEPAVAVIVPASVTHQPEQVVEPPVLTPPPSPARLVRPRVVVSRPLPTRVWPDVGRHGKHRWNPKDLDHDGDSK